MSAAYSHRNGSIARRWAQELNELLQAVAGRVLLTPASGGLGRAPGAAPGGAGADPHPGHRRGAGSEGTERGRI